MPMFLRGKHGRPLALLVFLALLFWGRVLVTGQVLLPGEMLRGFLPFGGDAAAPWTILQWDSLAQYYPWRHYAGEQLRAGQIPLWNPYQFTGTPFMANSQSAIFYPLNLPFWLLNTAYAFGVVALLHTLLAMFGTYFLALRWGQSRSAACLSASAFGFCGYLAAWALLPTLAATASWLPLALLLLEKVADDEKPGLAWPALAVALTCALLAGHAQIYLYLLMALALRLLFLRRRLRGLLMLEGAFITSLLLGSMQLLPTLELARLGHRAASGPSAASWEFWQQRALGWQETISLFIPGWPLTWGTLNENFGYVGTGVAILALVGALVWFKPIAASREELAGRRARFFVLALSLFGLFYALATPLAQLLYFTVPGISMMGGTGRALLLWSLGAALLAGFGYDQIRRFVHTPALPLVVLFWLGAELFSNAWNVQPIAPASSIYPATTLTTWLKTRSSRAARVLFLTPRRGWLPTEELRRNGRNHPPGVLPPNGAMVYGIHDISGYDSLAPRAYRAWTEGLEGEGLSPLLNGNMVLFNNLGSAELLDSLSVGYIVTPVEMGSMSKLGNLVLTADGCNVWQRTATDAATRADGRSFYPGWKDGVYAPSTYRLGLFISLCTLGLLSAGVSIAYFSRPGGPSN